MNTKGNKKDQETHSNSPQEQSRLKNQTIQCSGINTPLKSIYKIESMDSDTDSVVAILILKKYSKITIYETT